MTRRPSGRLPEIFLLAAAAFGPAAFGAVEPWSLAMVAAGICAGLFFYARLRRPELFRRLDRTLLAGVAAVLLIGLLQRLNPRSILEPMGRAPFTASAWATSRALRLWLLYAAALWLGARVLDGPSAVRRLAALVFGLACFVSVVGIIQTAQGVSQTIYGLRPAPYPMEPFGPYYDRDHAASLIVMGLFCGLGLLWDQSLLRRDRRERTDPFNSAAIQVLIVFGMGVGLFGLFLTRSLGALAALLAASLLLGAAAWRRRPVRLALLGFLLAAAPFVVSRTPVAHQVRNGVTVSLARKLTFSHSRLAAEQRLVLYRGALALARDFPWAGAGLGAFQEAYYPYQDRDIRALVDHAHSDWLELLDETGLAGLGAFALGLLFFLRASLKALSSPARRAERGLAFGLSGALAAFVLHGFVEFSFQIPANALLFLLLLAGLGGLAEPAPSREPDAPAPRPGPRGAALALGAVALAAAFVPAGLASVCYLTNQWERAAALDPGPKYFAQLARRDIALARNGREENVSLLRRALARCEQARLLDPASLTLRSLEGSVLDRLGLPADGRELAQGR